MMLTILNSKKTKEFLKKVEEQWGCELKTDHAYLENSEGKIFIANREIFDLNTDNLRINSLGLYIAEVKDNQIRLSIEGSQLIGPIAKKNILELNAKQARLWMKGNDLELETDCTGFVILKHNKDFLGSGKPKNGKILNHIPKIRRIHAED